MNQNGIEEHAMPSPDGGTATVGDRIKSFKDFLAAETERLHARHEFGLGGREIAQSRSHLVDAVVTRACRMVAEDLGPEARDDLSSSAIVALGGYGRQELAPSSDIDLLFLHSGKLSKTAEDFVHGVLPLLWDVGLKIGHSVRSVSESVQMALEELHVRNGMSEARILVGKAGLFHTLQRDLLTKVYRNPRANRRFYKAMRAEFLERREKHGPVIGMLEPNVKEGAGGLRDIHTVGWVGLAKHGARGLDGLLAAGLITPVDYGRILRAYDFLLRVRNEAHFRTGRAADVLTLDLQPSLARGLGYVDQGASAASEVFMRDFYFRAQEIQRFTDAFLRQAEFMPAPSGLLPLTARTKAVGPDRRYRVQGQYLRPSPDGVDFEADPLRLFEVFEVARQQGVKVGSELKEAIRQHLHLVDRSFRTSPEASARFSSLLEPIGQVYETLAAMHDTELLGAYMPEFRNLKFMVQHDFYHRYTVDEHTLKAIEALDRLAKEPEGPASSGLEGLRAALEEIEQPSTLVLALLLHDIGKGQGSNHVMRGSRIADEVCLRLGLDEQTAADIQFLVSKHLVMSRVSQRRDLTDQSLLTGFAQTVGSVRRLNLLYLLTFADISGVGPGIWNEWKSVLLGDLHAKTRELLGADDEVAENGQSRVALQERVLEDLPPEFLRSDVAEFLSHLPERYMLFVSSDLIARQFEMTHELGKRTLVTDWRQSLKGPYTVLSVCLRDRPGVLASVAGALTGSGLDILSVDIFTSDDGFVLDVFKVCEAMGSSTVQPVAERRFPAIDADLEAALEGRLDLALNMERQRTRQTRRRRRRKPSPPEVRFEHPEDPNGRTVIEVRADDEPGLVYRIAATLAELGMNISSAKIATEKHQALDVFYVTNAEGSPLLEAEEAAVERALIEALSKPT